MAQISPNLSIINIIINGLIYHIKEIRLSDCINKQNPAISGFQKTYLKHKHTESWKIKEWKNDKGGEY